MAKRPAVDKIEFDPKRAVYLNGAVGPQSGWETISGISKLYLEDPKTLIPLYVTTTGGSVSDAFAVYAYVTKLLKPILQTIILGEASSSAVVLFMMGQRRYMDEMAVLRLHNFSFTFEQGTTLNVSKARKIILDLEVSQGAYIDAIAKRSGGLASKKVLQDLMDKDAVILPDQALKLGLAHRIL